MKEYSSKIVKGVKIVVVAEGEQLPNGYVAVAEVGRAGRTLQAAIPQQLISEDFKLANRVAKEAQAYLMTMLCQ